MAFTPDQEASIGLIAEARVSPALKDMAARVEGMEARVDTAVRARLRILTGLFAGFGLSIAALFTIVLVQLPDLAVGRLLGDLADLNSGIQTAISEARVARDVAGTATTTAAAATSTASDASRTANEAMQQASSAMEDALLAKEAANAIVGLNLPEIRDKAHELAALFDPGTQPEVARLLRAIEDAVPSTGEFRLPSESRPVPKGYTDVHTEQVDFGRTFEEPPRVLAWVAGMEYYPEGENNWTVFDVTVKPESVTTHGCEIVVRAASARSLTSARIGWIAVNATSKAATNEP